MKILESGEESGIRPLEWGGEFHMIAFFGGAS